MWLVASFSALLSDTASHHYPLMSNRGSAVATKNAGKIETKKDFKKHENIRNVQIRRG